MANETATKYIRVYPKEKEIIRKIVKKSKTRIVEADVIRQWRLSAGD